MTSKVIWYIQRGRDGGDLMQSILIQLPTELKSKQSVFLLDAATASNTNTALKIAERLPRQKPEVVDNNSALLSHSVRSPMQRPVGVPPMKKHSLPRWWWCPGTGAALSQLIGQKVMRDRYAAVPEAGQCCDLRTGERRMKKQIPRPSN